MENSSRDNLNIGTMIIVIAMIFMVAFMILPSYPTYAMKFLIASLTGLLVYYAMN